MNSVQQKFENIEKSDRSEKEVQDYVLDLEQRIKDALPLLQVPQPQKSNSTFIQKLTQLSQDCDELIKLRACTQVLIGEAERAKTPCFGEGTGSPIKLIEYEKIDTFDSSTENLSTKSNQDSARQIQSLSSPKSPKVVGRKRKPSYDSEHFYMDSSRGFYQYSVEKTR